MKSHFQSQIKALTYALEKVAVVVETLLTVALVASQRVFTAALLTDFLSEQKTLINICRRKKITFEKFTINYNTTKIQ